MRTDALIAELLERGVSVRVCGGNLHLRPGRRLTSEIISDLRTHKAEILMLFSISPENLPEEWRDIWQERAAIMEYDGRFPRERAEALALEDVLRRTWQAGDAIGRDRYFGKEQCDGGS